MSRGSELEALVRHTVKLFKDQGLWLLQTSPRFIQHGRTGPNGSLAEGRVMGRGGLDFIGDWRGTALTFDCKSTKIDTRFPLDMVEPHQAVLVKKAHERGCLAFLLIEVSAQSNWARYFAVDWPVLGPAWKGYRANEGLTERRYPASLALEVLERDCVEVKRIKQHLRLIEAIEALRERATA